MTSVQGGPRRRGLRRLALLATFSALVPLIGCGGPAGHRPGSDMPPTAAPASPVPSPAIHPPASPVVTHTLAELATQPCAVMDDREASAMLGQAVAGHPLSQPDLECAWDPPAVRPDSWLSEVGFIPYPASNAADPFIAGPLGETPIQVAGHQAAQLRFTPQVCEVSVATGAEQSFVIRFVTSPSPSPDTVDPCALGAQIAAAILPRLR